MFELPVDPDPELNGYSENAVQNKVIHAAIQDVRQRQTSPYNFKGAVATLADLPSSGNKVNDTYYVEALKYRVTWTGDAWQQSSMEESKYTDELADLKNDLDVDRDITNWFISRNNNYLNKADLNIQNKFINPKTGALATASGYICGYIRLPCPGTYQLYSASNVFGVNRMYVPLFDGGKNYIRSLIGTEVDREVISFTVTKADFADAVYIGASIPSGRHAPMLILGGEYPADRTYQPPQYDFVDLKTLRFCGKCPETIDTLTTAGYYNDVSNEVDGLDWFKATSGTLIVLPYALNKTYGIQILISPSSPPNNQIWRRIYAMDGTYASPWQESVRRNETVKALKANSERISLGHVSLSGNYFDRENAEWLDGYDSGTAIVQAEGFHYAFAPLQGAGQYVRVMHRMTFGITGTVVRLYDAAKTPIKTVAAELIEGTHGYAFELTEDDALTAAYITMNYKDADGPGYTGLYYNSDAYPPAVGDSTPLPNFKPASVSLYKSVFVCDGDSIAAGAQDKPSRLNGWWGRIARDYSARGNNFSVGGGTITSELYYQSGAPRHWINEDIDTIHSEYPDLDYLILDGGTNDADVIGRFSGDTPPSKFGAWTATDFSGNYDNTTFCGAVETMFFKALTYWPKAKIGFIVPMQMGTNDGSSANRRKYFEEVLKIAEKWHIPVLDLWKISQMDARLTAYYDPEITGDENVTAGKCYYDGQHPTSYGYELMQGKIDAWINSL